MKNLLFDTPSQTELCACLAQVPAAPLLPPLGAAFWHERFAWPRLRQVMEALRPVAAVRRLVLRPAAPSSTMVLAYTILVQDDLSARPHIR